MVSFLTRIMISTVEEDSTKQQNKKEKNHPFHQNQLQEQFNKYKDHPLDPTTGKILTHSTLIAPLSALLAKNKFRTHPG